jgi:hypothetical protein
MRTENIIVKGTRILIDMNETQLVTDLPMLEDLVSAGPWNRDRIERFLSLVPKRYEARYRVETDEIILWDPIEQCYVASNTDRWTVSGIKAAINNLRKGR